MLKIRVEFDIEDFVTLRRLFDQLRVDIQSGKQNASYALKKGKYTMLMNYPEQRKFKIEEINGICYEIIESKINKTK